MKECRRYNIFEVFEQGAPQDYAMIMKRYATYVFIDYFNDFCTFKSYNYSPDKLE